MKCFNKKFLKKLMISISILVILLNCSFKSKVYAEDDIFGGELLGPIMNLLTGIADGVMDILHSTVLEQDETLIKLDGTADTWWNNHGSSVIGWLVGIGIVTLILVLAIPSGGVSIGAGAGILANLSGAFFIIKGATLAAIGGTIGGVIVGRVVEASMMADDIYLPVYKLSIQEIFANDVPLLDINFFNPNTSIIKELPDTTNEIVIYEESNEKNFTVSPNSYYLEINKQIQPFYVTNIERDETGKIIGDQINKDVTNEIIEQLSLIFTPLNANLKHGTKVTGSSGHNMTISLKRSPVTQANPYFNYTITFKKGNDIEPYTIFYNYSESGRSKIQHYL